MTTPSNNIQISPFLQEQRKFPTNNLSDLAFQNDLAYVDIAQAVNYRTIGIYPPNFALATGEKWFINHGSSYQQSLRQIYSFSGAGNIAHGINWSEVSFISPKSQGTYTDGTNWYGVIYASSGGIANQVTFYVDNTNIVVLVDASAPSVSSGYIILEWISSI